MGIYLTRSNHSRSGEDITYLRLAFCGELGDVVPGARLDAGIVRTLWMTPEEVRASASRHRSPLVVQCMEDYLAGKRHPLEMVHTSPEVIAAR